MIQRRETGIKEMLRLGLILVCYAVVSCTILAVVNNFTAPQIETNRINKAKKAMAKVFPEADNFKLIEDGIHGLNATMVVSNGYLAEKDGKVIGGVIQVDGPTYDKGKIIVGIDLKGTVTGMEILELSDSPGFGLKANDSSYKLPNGKTFYEQFSGKSALNGFSNGANFDSISGATITSKGLGNMVSEGTAVLLNYFKENRYE